MKKHKIFFILFITFCLLLHSLPITAGGNQEDSNAYTPGQGSYSLNEGIAPYNWFFKNHNEKVNTANGNAYFSRTDVEIKGRGISLVLQSEFCSQAYYWNFEHKKGRWRFDSELESGAIYRYAKGWRWKLPAFLVKKTIFGHGTIIYYTPAGKMYTLNDILKTVSAVFSQTVIVQS